MVSSVKQLPGNFKYDSVEAVGEADGTVLYDESMEFENEPADAGSEPTSPAPKPKCTKASPTKTKASPTKTKVESHKASPTKTKVKSTKASITKTKDGTSEVELYLGQFTAKSYIQTKGENNNKVLVVACTSTQSAKHHDVCKLIFGYLKENNTADKELALNLRQHLLS